MKYLNVLFLMLLSACAGSVFADVETERFVKKCSVYRHPANSHDFGTKLAKEKRKLLRHRVPITLDLSECGALRFRIAHPKGRVTYVNTDYPTMEDPDSKGNQYSWEPGGAPSAYWLFRLYGWEWAGWRLVHRQSGQFVETVNECAKAPIVLKYGFVATVCSGNYENETPSLYIADIRNVKTRWSGGLPLNGCKYREEFHMEEMRFENSSRVIVAGYCVEVEQGTSKTYRYPGRSIKQFFGISSQGVSTTRNGAQSTAEWLP